MGFLPVMEMFYTLQGEGVHAGRPAYFIRLAGCDVGCVWCDVKESWSQNDHPIWEVDNLIQEVVESGANRVVVTGGEPLMHNLDELTFKLQANGIQTHLETSGTKNMSGSWDWITFSPKKFKSPVDEVFLKASEFKVIVFHPSDILWAEELAKKIPSHCEKLLQPEWERRDEMTPVIISYLTSNPNWRLSLQTHKFLGIQ